MASSSASSKVCFNSSCKQSMEVSRQGWLCRTGDFADLCDRCASVFKEGKFCDTYHLNASGWRCCESCGKKIHCGCIVSFHTFILLDAGGIECLKCAKTEYILTPNPTWPSASHFPHGPAERKDVSSNKWKYISGSGPIPWQQAPSLFNSFKSQHELQLGSCSMRQNTSDYPGKRSVNDIWSVSGSEMIGDRFQATGIQYDGKHNLLKDDSFHSFFPINATPLSSLPEAFVAHDQKSEKGKVSGIHVQRLCPPPSVETRCSNNNVAGPSLENQAQNAKARGETQARHQPLPRYWPQFTNQEFQQLSGGSNAKITPLFEKVLSASDAGKIGRLVLPKKCAEAYLPPLTQPEGYPLVIQDLKGKDWVLQYRFWPNNNSRMYVLEGVTPCIQSMQLQAGDTVTFSRLEPEGKLIMGFRKAPHVSPFHKGNETTNAKVFSNEDTSNDSKSRNPDGTWAEVDKVSIRANKRKKGDKMGLDSKHFNFKQEEMIQLRVTLEQVQELLQPPLTNSPTVTLIDDVEFEIFQEAPIIGSPTELSADGVGYLCSTEVEPSAECLEHTLPMINHEDPVSLNTVKGLYALTDMADHDVKVTISGSKHKTTCIQTHSEQQVGNSVQNPTQSLYANSIRCTQNSNEDHKSEAGQSFEIYPNIEKKLTSPFKSQNIDLNAQPEREEESSPVSDSMGLINLVQESTQRYIDLQKPSINGIIDGSYKNHDP